MLEIEALTFRGRAQVSATPVDTANERNVPSKPPPRYGVPPSANLVSVVTEVQVVPLAVPAPRLKPSTPLLRVATELPAAGVYPFVLLAMRWLAVVDFNPALAPLKSALHICQPLAALVLTEALMAEEAVGEEDDKVPRPALFELKENVKLGLTDAETAIWSAVAPIMSSVTVVESLPAVTVTV